MNPENRRNIDFPCFSTVIFCQGPNIQSHISRLHENLFSELLNVYTTLFRTAIIKFWGKSTCRPLIVHEKIFVSGFVITEAENPLNVKFDTNHFQILAEKHP